MTLRIVFAGLMLLLPLAAQNTPAAQAKVDEAKAVAATDKPKAAALLKEAIELDPDLAAAHDQFLRVVASKEERNKAYEEWVAKFPGKAIFPAKLADALLYDDFKKSEMYAKKAIATDPKCAQAYMTLSLIAEAGGNEVQRREYLKKAADAAPEDPSWFFYYTMSLEYSDPALYRSQSLEVARRFPNHERGAQALYWLAFNTADKEEAIRYYLQLKNSFPPAKSGWSADGMSSLFELYTERDPSKALALANEMSAAKPNDKSWPALTAYADALVQAAQLAAAGKAADAVVVLDAVKLPRLQIASPYYLAKASAQQAAGDPQKAYETLLGQMGQSPTDSLKAALVKAGAKLQKDDKQVSADLWALLDSKAKPAADLETTRFGDESRVTLADYRGKVVLLNFWYPFCGPCRGEFPYLQTILDKYASRGFVILSPSVHPLEDQLVLPYMNGMHWGFIPLHSNTEYAEKSYAAKGFPANFLIDQQGRVVYKPGVIRGLTAQRMLELQIETVLEQGAQELKLDADRPVAAFAKVEPASVPPGGQGTLKVTMKLMDGGHANSNAPADPNLIATAFTPKESAGIVWGKPQYPEPQTVREWYAKDPLSVFMTDSVITVPFTVDKSAPAKPISLNGVLLAQVCDHEQCYPPTNVKVTAEVQVEMGAKK